MQTTRRADGHDVGGRGTQQRLQTVEARHGRRDVGLIELRPIAVAEGDEFGPLDIRDRTQMIARHPTTAHEREAHGPVGRKQRNSCGELRPHRTRIGHLMSPFPRLEAPQLTLLCQRLIDESGNRSNPTSLA